MPTEGRTFSYREALATFPEVRQWTHTAVRQIEALYNQVHSQSEHAERRLQIEGAIEEIIGEWARRVSAIGCEVKGLWLVDWDSGDGYYCWRYPEESLGFFHSYEDGFDGRVPIA